MPLPSSPFPRSAPALTTSFSLPSLSTFPPSPANPYALPKEYRGPFASLSRKGSRWNTSDEQDANGQDDEEERLKRSSSERSLRKSKQLESQVLSLKTLVSEQANVLSELRETNFDLSETVDRLRVQLKDSEDERRAGESERAWLAKEVAFLRKVSGQHETPPTASYVARPPGSAGRTPKSDSVRVRAAKGKENVPSLPVAKNLLGRQQKDVKGLSIRTDIPRSSPLAPTLHSASARLQTSPSPFAPNPNPSNKQRKVKRTLSARRKRSVELLAVSHKLTIKKSPTPMADLQTQEKEKEEGEWASIVRSHAHRPVLSSSSSSSSEIDHPPRASEEETLKVVRQANLRPSLLPRWTLPIWDHAAATAKEEDGSAEEEEEEKEEEEGRLMQVLKQVVEETNVKTFRHLVKKYDASLLSTTEFLNQTRTTVLGLTNDGLVGNEDGKGRKRAWFEELEEIVRDQMGSEDEGAE